jgi:LEA14-like dessication related protein
MWLLVACAPRLPSAEIQDVELVSMGWEEAVVVLHVAVDNPMLVQLPISALHWSLLLDGKPFLKGTLPEAPPLAANTVTQVPVPVSLRYTDLMAASQLGRTELPYQIQAEIVVDTWLGPYTLPVEYSGVLPALSAPELELVDLGLGLDSTPEGSWAVLLDLSLLVSLPAGLQLSELTWTLRAADQPVANGRATVSPDGTLYVPVWLQPTSAAQASWTGWFDPAATVLLQAQGTLQTPLGDVPIELEKEMALHGP